MSAPLMFQEFADTAEMGIMPFNGLIYMMHKDCFRTPDLVVDQSTFFTQIYNGGGTTHTQYVTPGSSVPILPRGLRCDKGAFDSSYESDTEERIMDRALVLRGGEVFRSKDSHAISDAGYSEEDVGRLCNNVSKLIKSDKDLLKEPCVVSGIMNLQNLDKKETDDFVKSHFQELKEDMEDYVCIVIAQPSCMVSIAGKGITNVLREENIKQMGDNSKTSNSMLNVYVSPKTVKIPVDNSRLNCSYKTKDGEVKRRHVIAKFLYTSDNKFMITGKTENDVDIANKEDTQDMKKIQSVMGVDMKDPHSLLDIPIYLRDRAAAVVFSTYIIRGQVRCYSW